MVWVGGGGRTELGRLLGGAFSMSEGGGEGLAVVLEIWDFELLPRLFVWISPPPIEWLMWRVVLCRSSPASATAVEEP